MSRKAVKKDAILDRARALGRRVEVEDYASWRAEFAVSDSYLRKTLRDSGVPVSPIVEGVRQDSLEHLERTLLALLKEYCAAEAIRRRIIRGLLITAKEHARLALRSPHTNRKLREEAILWLTIWLEDPELFPSWLVLRKRNMERKDRADG
jgi:hypothetical protein